MLAEKHFFRAREKCPMDDEQAARYGAYLSKIAGKNDGEFRDTLTPEQIVAAAEPEHSPLHDWFEWNNDDAAQQYRLVQAREMLRFIEVVRVERAVEPVRAFHVVRIEGQSVYAKESRVFSDEELRKQVIDAALAQLESWQRRYDQYVELAGINAAITKEIQRVKQVN
jgi:hypothetical protein